MATIARRSWPINWRWSWPWFHLKGATIGLRSCVDRGSWLSSIFSRPIVVIWWRSPRSCAHDESIDDCVISSVSFVRWRSEAPCASTRCQVIGKSISLTPDFAHMCWWMIAWTRVHAIDASRLDPTLVLPPRHLHRGNVWEHSPTQKKKRETISLKRGAVKRYCVTAPIL